MNDQQIRPSRKHLRVLPSGDPYTAFHRMTPEAILSTYGLPRNLLSQSAKTEKSLSVGVSIRALFLTPGILCPAATPGCLRSCLGHSSGRMVLPTSTMARDRRTALLLESPDEFLTRLDAELTLFRAEARHFGLQPAVRLNGTSDLPWELLHPGLFESFPDVRFFDYTKIRSRVRAFLFRAAWPANYHLTFSVDQKSRAHARHFLSQGGTVAAVFWPFVPPTWMGFPVIDGDRHDARFLDPAGNVVGLRAKGSACVDLDGFTVRLCPLCVDDNSELAFSRMDEDTHRHTVHECVRCGYQLRARWLIPGLSPSMAPTGAVAPAASSSGFPGGLGIERVADRSVAVSRPLRERASRLSQTSPCLQLQKPPEGDSMRRSSQRQAKER